MSARSPLTVVAVNGSPSHPSRSRTVAEAVLSAIEERGAASGQPIEGEVIDLASLDPAALLAIASDAEVDAARDAVAAASILVVATPVYRATYTALTKTIFDLLPQGALEGTVVVPIATGYGADHHLSVDHGLRPLVASLGGWTVPSGIYATKADIGDDGAFSEKLTRTVAAASDEALALAGALAGQ
ncbi:MAG: FMN reductase [Acidimicrobiales bacterium]|nr:FMN reductase [Acidimicrobiales bacterium]